MDATMPSIASFRTASRSAGSVHDADQAWGQHVRLGHAPSSSVGSRERGQPLRQPGKGAMLTEGVLIRQTVAEWRHIEAPDGAGDLRGHPLQPELRCVRDGTVCGRRTTVTCDSAPSSGL